MQTSAKELRQMASDVDDMHHEAMRNFKEEADELHLDVAKKSRRSFMTKVGAAGVGGALLSTGGASLGFGSLLGTAGAAGLTDTQIAGYAQSVELAAVAAYTAAAPALKGDALAVAQPSSATTRTTPMRSVPWPRATPDPPPTRRSWPP